MRCKRCKMECADNELIDGYCEVCRDIIKSEAVRSKYIVNALSKRLTIIEILFVLIGVGLTTFCFTFNIIYGIISLCISVFIVAILSSLSEIIQLLEDIKNK